jgi:hypothetical protein
LEATDDILERHPFHADESDITKDPLVVATEAFLRKNLQTPPYRSDSAENLKKSNRKQIVKNVMLISLSGGKQ